MWNGLRFGLCWIWNWKMGKHIYIYTRYIYIRVYTYTRVYICVYIYCCLFDFCDSCTCWIIWWLRFCYWMIRKWEMVKYMHIYIRIICIRVYTYTYRYIHVYICCVFHCWLRNGKCWTFCELVKLLEMKWTHIYIHTYTTFMYVYTYTCVCMYTSVHVAWFRN